MYVVESINIVKLQKNSSTVNLEIDTIRHINRLYFKKLKGQISKIFVIYVFMGHVKGK